MFSNWPVENAVKRIQQGRNNPVTLAGGTPFQRRVYRVVSSIPSGQTRSYRWVAQKIGKPKAARAVGQALKRNPYPLTIPCHRVVKSDGSIGGYSRGTAEKKRLLDSEIPNGFRDPNF